MKGIRLDRFVLLLIFMIALAYWVPEIESALPLEQISNYGIAGIFFLYGLKLSPQQMRAGLSNWRLHMLVQSSTFLLFPLVVLAILPAVRTDIHFNLWLGLFFLASLPSTVSSSVVMVSIARGNIAGAIFNASISGLIGILLTPLWIGLFLEARNADFDLVSIFLELMIKILVPVLVGMALHRFWGEFASRHSKQLTIFDKTVILIIVYKSFSQSFSNGVFAGIGWAELTFVGLVTIFLFFLIYMIIKWVSDRIGLNRSDRITALFCGSKKSLVHGTVFSSVLFAGVANSSLFLVPIMIYHAFQLLIISIIAQKYSREPDLH